MKETKMTIDIGQGRHNFHNAGPISLKLDLGNTAEWNGDDLILLSTGQARRIEKHFCGMSDCTCGSGPLIEVDQGIYAIHPNVLQS